MVKIANLPAGINDSGIEIFRTDKYRACATYQGKKFNYLDLPISVREIFQSELIRDLNAIEFLIKEGLESGSEMEEAFVSCRYGNFDDTPDHIDGKTIADVPNCGIEDTCPGFGILCKIPKGKNGSLTRQEYKITRMISQGLLDKEIANNLGISIETVKAHTARIRKKLDVFNRVEIALWAHKRKFY